MLPILRTLFLAFVLALPQAHAGTISTDAAQAGSERSRIKALLERPELAGQLEQLGILQTDAVARVDAMTDAEVRALAGRLEALPAGGDIANQTLLLLIILVVLLLIAL